MATLRIDPDRYLIGSDDPTVCLRSSVGDLETWASEGSRHPPVRRNTSQPSGKYDPDIDSYE